MLQKGDSIFWVLCIAQGTQPICWTIALEGIYQCIIIRKKIIQA